MKKVIAYTAEAIDVLAIFEALPHGADCEIAIKLRGEWLPDEYETKEGEQIRSITVEEMRTLIGGEE